MLPALVVLALAALIIPSGCVESGDLPERKESKPSKRAKPVKAQQPANEPQPEARGKTTGARPASGQTLASVLLRKLRVRLETPFGYERDLFYHWADLGACDVREIVLARQDREDGPCGSESGRWVSAYDGDRTIDPGSFDVDHFVPLAEAWASGAKGWPEARRDAFANDLYRFSLIAVSASSNRSKSDQDPSEWMPENQSFACGYIARWIAVKYRWRLSVDAREKSFLTRYVKTCPASRLALGASIKRAA